jgi:flagellin
MNTVNDMVIRIRELVVQAANDTNAHEGTNLAQSDRQQIQREINELLNEIDDVTLRTEFNTRTLLDGSVGVGVTLADLAAGTDLANVFIAQTGLNTAWFAAATGGFSAAATVEQQSQTAAILGALNSAMPQMLNLIATLESVDITPVNTHFTSLASAVNTAIAATMDNLVGTAPGNITNTQLLAIARAAADEPEGSLWFHIGANSDQGVNVSIKAVNVSALSLAGIEAGGVGGFQFEDLRNDGLVDGSGVMRVKGEDINQFLDAIDGALAHVNGQRAMLGAMQNRLEFTIENLNIASENLSAANSRIKDADMAKEMMRFTQTNVLQQAAISMLAQANQAPQNILQLLR